MILKYIIGFYIIGIEFLFFIDDVCLIFWCIYVFYIKEILKCK